MSVAWNAGQYARFEDERSRPAAELLARVPVTAPRRVVDLGCGPGNSTALLVARYPNAAVAGLDSSPEMLVAARARLPATHFIEADLATWKPEPGTDLLFSNATFQWVPDHFRLTVRLVESLSAGGALAFQVPDNLSEPTHTLMRDVALEGPWKGKFHAPIEREEVAPARTYYDLLAPHARSVDIWTTVYNHVLAGPDAVLEWVKGTGLRPYLARLDAEEGRAYLSEYRERLSRAYPPQVDGKVLLRFPRLFVVAAT